MFSKFLPLLIVTAVLCLALGLLTYQPTTAAAQKGDGDQPFKLFNPVAQPAAPVNFTLFNVGDADKTQAATGSDAPAASSTLRISQVYTRGGEAGATYQNDFVELFNAGTTNVDLNGWSLVVITFEGSTQQSKGATFNQSFMIAPGTHVLFRFAGNGPNGQATPGEFAIITDTSLGSTSGQIMLLGPGQGLPSGCPAGTNAVVDFLGYGSSTCSEGSVAPVPPANKSLTRINGGCTDTDNNLNDFALLDPNPRTFSSAVTPCGAQPSPTPTPSPTATPIGSPTPAPSPTPTPTPGNSALRISQVYTRGGEAGATYQNDFVEIFNSSSSNVDINGWSLVVDTVEGSTPQAIGATFNQSFVISPGAHLLFRFNGNGSNGQATPGEFPITNISLGSTSGKIMLLGPGQGLPSGCPAGTGAVQDFVGYGSTTCSEGSPAPVPPSNKSLTRINGGCTDTNNNFNDFALLDPNPRTFSSALTPCGGSQPTPTPTPAAGSQFNFSAAQYNVNENAGKVTIAITRSGDVSTAASVDGATSNGTASAGSDYTAAAGTINFAPGQTQINIDIAILDDSVAEPDETILLTLSHPTGNGSIGATGTSTIFIRDNELGSPSPGPSPTPTASPTPTTSPVPGATGLRISQIYTRAGEAGATYQNDFVEVFNASTSTIDLNGWSMVVDTLEGTTSQAIGATFNQSFSVPPGMHLLFKFNGNGSNGQATPGEFPITNISLGSTSGKVFLLGPGQGLPSGCPAQTSSVIDYVGYGSANCSEGSPAPAPTATTALMRNGNGCTDTNNNAADFSLVTPNPRTTQSALTPCSGTNEPPGSSFNFSSSSFDTVEGAGNATITVTRSGNLGGPATINFATANGTATAGSDYTAVSGTLSFAINETQKTFNVPIIDDNVVESSETVSLSLSSPTGSAIIGSVSSATLTIRDNDSNSGGGGTGSMRISQVYTRGGEAGATYQNDFIELFNAGNATVDLVGWSVVIRTFEGSTDQSLGVSFTNPNVTSFPVPAGAHLLLRFKGNGANGQTTPGDYPVFNDISLGSTSGQIMLLAKGQGVPTGCPAGTSAVVDFVGYGSTTCSEGSPAPAPTTTKSIMRTGVALGCIDDNNNTTDFFLSDPNPRPLSAALTPCGAATSPNQFNFSTSLFDSTEGSGKATITVNRSGDVSSAATVDYATSDSSASERSDYTTALGTLRFAAGETQKSFDVLITDDGFAETFETVVLSLSNPTGNASLGAGSSAQLVIRDDDALSSNRVDNTSEFVDQSYHDFLNRTPDASGLAFWTNNIDSCAGDANCRLLKRVDTSAAFFLSIEFQKTGFLVYRLFKASLPETSQRPRGFPRYREFVRDSQDIGRGVIVGNAGYEQLLEANTVDFINRFVTRPEFLANYPTSLTAAQYVDKLNSQSGSLLTGGQRDALVNGLTNGTETRATVLRKIAENPAFITAETSRAFVLMQYFGYLRRNPDDTPNTDFSGYDFWLSKLNQFNGDYKAAEMVKAFITSAEFRNRFGP